MHVIYILPGRIIEAICNSMDLQRILNTPPHPRFPSEIPETPPPLPESQISTQSWDSQLGPQPATLSQSLSQSPSQSPSQSQLHTPTKRSQNCCTDHNTHIAIRTALQFKIPYKKICKELG